MAKSIERWGLAERFGNIVATGLGIVLALTPLALWIAWTATLVVYVMLIAAVSAVLMALLLEASRPKERNPGLSAGADGRVILPDEFIEEVHRLFPLTYHHSRLETPRFRQAMKRMSQLIEGSKPGEPPR